MEERKKFTYRYDESIEKLLNDGLQKYGLSSINKLIDLLVIEAIEKQPKAISTLKNDIKKLQDQLKNTLGEKQKTEDQLNELKSCIKQDFENRQRIKDLIQ